MFVQNKRPTLLSLPSGAVLGPGEKLEVDEAAAEALKKHPCTGMWLAAGYLEMCSDSGQTVKVEPTNEALQKSAQLANVKDMKLAQIGKATSADALVQMATNEMDPDVLRAINERAVALKDQS